MADKQIQVRNREYGITPRTRPRGITAQVWTVVLQPGYFFRTMPMLADTRSWLWAAILVLAVSGISAVRQEALLNESAGVNTQVPDFGGAPPGVDMGGGGGIISGGGFEVVPGGGLGGEIPGDVGVPPPTDTGTGDTPSVTTTWTTALLAASGIIVGWIILSILLSEVSLFNGRLPALGQNLQIAIWSSVPLGLMAVLQLVFYAAGGEVGASGVSGLLADWDAYQTMSPLAKSLILSFTSRLTLFWLWSLILIYIGARYTLEGKRFASIIVVIAWAIVLVVLPVATGSIKAEEAPSEEVITGDPSFDPSLSGESPIITDPSGLPIDGGMIETTPEVGSEGENTAEASDSGEIESTAEADSENDVTNQPEFEGGGNTRPTPEAETPSGGKPAQSEAPAGSSNVIEVEPAVEPNIINRPGGG